MAIKQGKTMKPGRVPKGIKVLDKSVDLSKRMKNAYTKTKRYAEETQNMGESPSAYAGDMINEKVHDALKLTAYGVPNARRNAQKSFARVKDHFKEVTRQLPGERRRAAEQAQKSAAKMKSRAEKTREIADNSKNTAAKTQKAVSDAKQTLREVKQSGRRTMKEVKQSAKSSGKAVESTMKPAGRTTQQAARTASQPTRAAMQTVQTSSRTIPQTIPRTMPWTAAPSAKSARKTAKQTAKGTIKTAKKSIKTAERTARQAVKAAQHSAKAAHKTAQSTVKAARTAEKAARAAAKTAVKTAQAAGKALIATVKAAIAAVKGLVALIAAGGWVAVAIILLICLVGLFVGSVYGIFFANEPNPSTGQTVNSVIAEINAEYTAQIDGIIAADSYDLLDMSGARAAWKEVLAVYTVQTVSSPDNPMEVATMDDAKAAILRVVFADMNRISHTLAEVDVVVDVFGEDGLPTGETVTETKIVLRIVVSHKTVEEMAALYSFSDEQKEWLAELLKPDYHHMWNALLYGVTGIGNATMLAVADTQIGNIGGEPYWSWYGFTERVEWCACFVSWCAEQCGYIDAGIIPRFALCEDGMDWFKRNGRWRDNGYTPAPGDIIFFNWDNNPDSDHVGIVERVEGGYVYTIEGNVSDSVAQQTYRIDNGKIIGYGTLYSLNY